MLRNARTWSPCPVAEFRRPTMSRSLLRLTTLEDRNAPGSVLAATDLMAPSEMMSINRNLSVAVQLRTIVHQGSHLLDTMRGGFLLRKPIGSLSGMNSMKTEIRALVFADDFALVNRFPRDFLPGNSRLRGMLDILEENGYAARVSGRGWMFDRGFYRVTELLENWTRELWPMRNF